MGENRGKMGEIAEKRGIYKKNMNSINQLKGLERA